MLNLFRTLVAAAPVQAIDDMEYVEVVVVLARPSFCAGVAKRREPARHAAAKATRPPR